ncbi:hypothetical protein [Serratia bockelmannii]|uniref:hypothetical protein n=1 Tax=Serratia bockelmannii TaxID=2703793 RepID=UPI00313F1EEC
MGKTTPHSGKDQGGPSGPTGGPEEARLLGENKKFSARSGGDNEIGLATIPHIKSVKTHNKNVNILFLLDKLISLFGQVQVIPEESNQQ